MCSTRASGANSSQRKVACKQCKILWDIEHWGAYICFLGSTSSTCVEAEGEEGMFGAERCALDAEVCTLTEETSMLASYYTWCSAAVQNVM